MPSTIISTTGPQLHVLLAVDCAGQLKVMFMKLLVLVVVIAYLGVHFLTEVVCVQLLVIIEVILEEETSLTLVVLQLQLAVFVTCEQLELFMLVMAV